MHRNAGLIAVLALACAREAPPPSQVAQAPAREPAPSASSSSPRADSVLQDLEAVVAGLGHSRQAIAAKLGAPLRHALVAAENAEGETDTLITLTYPGLEIILRRAAHDSQEYFSNVRALDTSFVLPRHLALFRASDTTVRGLVGEPRDVQLFGDTTVAGYETPDGLVIQFYYLNSRLVRIRWVYELG
jgi:hypothetical protein